MYFGEASLGGERGLTHPQREYCKEVVQELFKLFKTFGSSVTGSSWEGHCLIYEEGTDFCLLLIAESSDPNTLPGI